MNTSCLSLKSHGFPPLEGGTDSKCTSSAVHSAAVFFSCDSGMAPASPQSPPRGCVPRRAAVRCPAAWGLSPVDPRRGRWVSQPRAARRRAPITCSVCCIVRRREGWPCQWSMSWLPPRAGAVSEHSWRKPITAGSKLAGNNTHAPARTRTQTGAHSRPPTPHPGSRVAAPRRGGRWAQGTSFALDGSLNHPPRRNSRDT